jgi:anti-sigma regulatory factor (Ser/Thr protein kinase)
MDKGVLSGVRSDEADAGQAAEPELVRRASRLAWQTFGPWVFGVACSPDWPMPGGQGCPVRAFGGTAGQVRLVREFVRGQLAGHSARDDAVTVASELASNSIAHSASRAAGGRFVVHVAVLRSGNAGVIVTDEGGPLRLPVPGGADADAESGRGLAVVRALSCFFRIADHHGLRSFIAEMPGGHCPLASSIAVRLHTLENSEI